jgi:hypothetical protein
MCTNVQIIEMVCKWRRDNICVAAVFCWVCVYGFFFAAKEYVIIQIFLLFSSLRKYYINIYIYIYIYEGGSGRYRPSNEHATMHYIIIFVAVAHFDAHYYVTTLLSCINYNTYIYIYIYMKSCTHTVLQLLLMGFQQQ